MDNKVRVLDVRVSNKIAAGEVVERPASVIKELVENSIDAGASSIVVEIENGGMSYMRVADNGKGIDKQDVKTCFLRHATSKIHDAEDLFDIKTLGFRGEALASIAAVAHVDLKTRRRGDDFGTHAYVSAGTFMNAEPCGCPDGTVIEVSDLFFNVPARLKFMKAARTEASYISDFVLRMILAYPSKSIKLINNGKLLYHSSGRGGLKNAVYSVYGAEIIPHMVEINYSDDYMSIDGFISTEQLTKANRTHQSFFVNGRYIRSQKLSSTLLEAYDTRIMAGRFPVAILNFGLKHSELDVNIHPNKMEVKFADENRVAGTLYTVAKKALGGVKVPKFELENNNVKAEDVHMKEKSVPTSEEREKLFSILMSQANFSEPVEENKISTFELNKELPFFGQRDIKKRDEAVRAETKEDKEEKVRAEEAVDVNAHEQIPFFPGSDMPVIEKESEAVIEEESSMLTQVKFDVTPYEILGCIYDSFWLICQNENLFILDQHAAHERMIYEQLTRGELKANSQMLLIPFIVKLTADEYEVYSDNEDLFSEFGFIIEPFGTLTLRISAIPHILKKAEDDRFFRDAIAQLSKHKNTTLTDLKREALIGASCKAAVKLGNTVPKETIKAMLDEYNAGEIPLTCPHGRPVMIVITKKDMFKKFKRIV